MTELAHKRLIAAQALLFLVPATAGAAFLLIMALPAVPQRELSAPQLAFDVGFLLTAGGIVAGWRLATACLRRRRAGIGRLARGWLVLLVLAALIGLAAAVVAVRHLLEPLNPGVAVGFALLAPGALLAPLAVQLLLQRKTGP